MAIYTITYDLDKVTDGYMARYTSNPMATAFGKTKDEAGDNLAKAIRGYLKLYPDKADKLLTVLTKEVQVAD